MCAICADSPANIVDRVVIPTTTPAATLGAIRRWLGERAFDAIGIASFGPIDARRGSRTYGYITSTPKEGWANTDVLSLLGVHAELSARPHAFDTDVNAPALAEFLAAPSTPPITSCAYITVGTGVGVGLVVNGDTVRGLLHPEAGHVMPARYPADTFAGVCKFHKCCVEGMCSSVAIAARLGAPMSELPAVSDAHPVWDTTAHYIAALCATLVLVASPEKIVLGGGVMQRACLLDKVRAQTRLALNEYIQADALLPEHIADFIAPSRWGADAGIIGAAYLAKSAYDGAVK